MEIAYLFRALVRHKWIILICTFLALGISYFLTKNLKKKYKSVAQLSTGFTVSDLPGPNQVVNYMQSELQFNNAKENFTSPKVLSLVSYHLLLHDFQSSKPFVTLAKHPAFVIDKQSMIILLSSHLDSISMLSPAIPEEKKILTLLDLYGYDIETLDDQLKVDRFLKSDYINIEFTSENADLSAFVVNTLCDEFKRFYGLNEKQRTNLSINSLDSLVRQKKAILDQKQAAKEHFLAARGVLDANLEGTNKLNQITTFENLLITEEGIQKNQSYRVQQLDLLVQTAKSKGLTSISAPNGIAGNDNSEYLTLRKQYNDLYNEYIQNGGNDPATKKRLDVISQNMRKLNIVENPSRAANDDQSLISLEQLTQKRIDAQAQLEEANQKIASIESKLAELRGGLNGIAATSAAAQQYDKDIQMASAEYTSTKDQLNIALNFNEIKPENFKQTLIGQPALKPESSKRLLIILAAAIGTFLFSCFVILVLEVVDQSIKTPSHFQELTSLPLIGTINRIKLNKNNVIESAVSFDEKEKQRKNAFLELLRKLRFEIENSNKKIFLFTSTKPQQGKTTLIQALSYILSLGKKKVLIIDTNFCDNELTKSGNALPVLEKFELNGRPFNMEDLKDLITPTSVQGIDIIGCQGGDYTPTEILPKNHLLNYLSQITGLYDYVFLEGASLNEFSDTKELLPYADGLIAVFSSESDFTAADKESVRFLVENKSKFLGAILNKVANNNLEL